MIVLDRLNRKGDQLQFVLLFGVGLIGRHILLSLLSTGLFDHKYFSFDWVNASSQDKDIEAILAYIHFRLSGQERIQCRIDIVWAAGKAGFGDSESEFQSELVALGNIIGLASKLNLGTTIRRSWFHLFSSAGGIFEGKRFVSRDTQPAPLRTYGRMKIKQENLVSSCLPRIFKAAIYRPSSVYGLAISGNRIGLVSALMRSAIYGGVAEISGNLNTLRDFVLVTDIANFVRMKILYADPVNEVCTLCSGKPSTVYEVINQIQHAANHKLYLRYQVTAKNALDNSYCPSALPDNWYPTGLKEGIIQTFARTSLYHANGRTVCHD